MTHIVKLLLALGLGAAAAVTNWLYLSLQTRPTEYVAAARELAAGTVLGEKDMLAVPVPGDPQELKRSLIPYANRAVMLGTRLPRALQRGDVVFARDLTPPDDGQKWDVIGPFELISVGEQFTESSGRGDSLLRSTRGNTITIAVGADFDARTTRLLNVISADVGGQGKAAAVKIVAVQVLPAEGQARPASSTVPPAARADTAAGPLVYQTVSLEGIPNVPGVLLAGDFIRFVVPQEPRY